MNLQYVTVGLLVLISAELAGVLWLTIKYDQVRGSEQARDRHPAGKQLPKHVEQRIEVDQRVSAAVQREQTGAQPVVGRPSPNRQLTPPPMIEGQTLKSWLIYRSRDEGVWNYVVTEMYERAAAQPEIADYFQDTIKGGRFSDLQTHFLGALMIVTNSGVTQGVVDAMKEAHRGVRNSSEQPINSVIYDAVINTLVQILREVGVPEMGIEQLGQTILPLRDAVVRA
jgi:hypothetical protein